LDKATKITLKGKPEEGTNEQEVWDMIDSQVMTLITNSLEPKLSETIYCETATESWREIEGQFGNKKNYSQIYQTQKRDCTNFTKKWEISDLIGLVKAKYEELKTYRPYTADLNIIREREETDRVYTFLAALDPSYEAIRAQILLSSEKLSFDEVASRVRQEATRWVAMAATDSNPKPEAQAFSAQRLYDRRLRGKGETVKCIHCKRDGHTSDRCWVLHPHLKPRKFIELAKKKEGFKTLEPSEQRRAFASVKGEEAKDANTETKGERLDRVEKNACYSPGPDDRPRFI
jgi:gag-polypeptide of LTR copia-type